MERALLRSAAAQSRKRVGLIFSVDQPAGSRTPPRPGGLRAIRLEGARLLPLSLFNEWAPSLDRERETVFICHHGVRSAQVCAFLSRQGFTKIYNLAGGIDRWSKEVDPSVPRY